MTCTVSAQAARKLPRLKATLMSRALSWWPTSASTAPPTRGQASRKARAFSSASTSVFLQLFEVADVQAVELLADLEHEHAQDEHADQHVERDAQLHDHGHAVGGRGGGEEEAVFH